MRYMIGSQFGWAAIPFIVLVGAAYLWLADRFVNRKAERREAEIATSVTKAA